jgi:hypothetical protein
VSSRSVSSRRTKDGDSSEESEFVSSFIGISAPQAASSMPEEPAWFHAISDSSVTDNFNIKTQSE